MAPKNKFAVELAVSANNKKRKTTPVPLVRDLSSSSSVEQLPVQPTSDILNQFKDAHLIFAFDLETHDIIRESASAWRNGQHGFQTRVSNSTLKSLRIIQIGWAVGEIHSDGPTIYSRHAKPNSFKVTAEGAAKHGVTQTFVEEHGLPLESILQEFIASAQKWFARGARLVAHQIEFDAGVVAEELQRCGLHQQMEFWDKAVRSGICTMDPVLCNWIRDLSGDVDAQGRSRSGPLGLKDCVRFMVPQSADLRRHHHAADKDAEMVWLLCKAIVACCAQTSPSKRSV